MWSGYEEALGRYSLTMCDVWTELGFADTCAATIRHDLAQAGVTSIRRQPQLERAGDLPGWLGDPAFHRSHQSSLVRKNPAHYTFEDGATVPLAYVTAGASLVATLGIAMPDKGPVPANGKVLLVWGGSSSVGSFGAYDALTMV